MSELHHECGLVAVYHLPDQGTSRMAPPQGGEEISRLVPRMLLDVQNRGQLSAGFTTFQPRRKELIRTYKALGTVSEVFHLSHKARSDALQRKHAGRAAIGHVRYATCGPASADYAQPFERRHLQKHKWFSFAFNGQLANYQDLRREVLADSDNHLARDTDTEIILHFISRELSGDRRPTLLEICRSLGQRFDGAWCLVLLNALGEMLIARDPLGFRPLCYAIEGPLVAAASESVALLNLGFSPQSIESLPPGMALTVSHGQVALERFAPSPRRAHCFFEWIYFANVASTLDERSVYVSRKVLGEELARLEHLPIDAETIVVPVPDTSKAAADAMAYQLGVPSLEGLIRNRYTGRTFIEGSDHRKSRVEMKYTPLREVLEGKRVILVEDSIVRSTTLKVLVKRVREIGLAREVHVRVACPPIVAPCFYGIDMSTVGELFAPRFLDNSPLNDEAQARMAAELGADSLRYLPVESIARAIDHPPEQLCRACVTGRYPTAGGEQLYQIALSQAGVAGSRTYEAAPS